MANKFEQGAVKNEGKAEQVSRWLRNINLIGAFALVGAGVVLESAVLTTLGIINAAQAGFFELTRRLAKRKQAPKLKPA